MDNITRYKNLLDSLEDTRQLCKKEIDEIPNDSNLDEDLKERLILLNRQSLATIDDTESLIKEFMTKAQVADPTTSARKEGAFLSGLRVRIKELAQEAKFIRHEENKLKPQYRMTEFKDFDPDKWGEFMKLQEHRRTDVRNAARAAQLAYAFLRGKPYKLMEPKTYSSEWLMFSIRKEVKRLVAKFGKPEYSDEVDNWFASDTV